MKAEKIIREYADIKKDYEYNPDIMSEEEEKIASVKKVINTKLSVVDKTLILLYIDCLSFRKLGKRLGVSHMIVRREIIRIRNIILAELKKEN